MGVRGCETEIKLRIKQGDVAFLGPEELGLQPGETIISCQVEFKGIADCRNTDRTVSVIGIFPGFRRVTVSTSARMIAFK